MNSKTIEFFKEISKIPRESGNEEKIANYIVNFAKERNLTYIKDEFNNVIIKKYHGNDTPIILQVHMDMVCEKEKNKIFDFAKDSIELLIDDDYIKANGTTLGADNGIGIAQILNILDSDIKRSIEAIFTVSEETTMSGAINIDLKSLKGKQMINLDGFDSDTILVETASFNDIDIKTSYTPTKISNKNLYKIELSGLLGGHSGFDINKQRGNAIVLLANLLLNFKDLRISEFIGGTKINVIPTTAEVIIETKENIYEIINIYKHSLQKKYKNLKIDIKEIELKKNLLTQEESYEFINSILKLKHGILHTNNRKEVTTSQNLATVSLSKNLIQIGLRSSRPQEEQQEINRMKCYCNEKKYKFEIIGYQPGFITTENSHIVEKMKQTYYQLNKKYPKIKSMHIAVEAGLIKEKIKDLEVIIISPEIIDAHTINERVKISSIKLCDNWLYNYLKDN